MVGIYKFTNKINGKTYIGQSSNINRRFYEHLRRSEQQIDQAIQKHGIDNFTFEILEECEIEELNEKESFWIEHFKSRIPNGYNVKDSTNALRGESNGQSILTDEDIIFIRICYRDRVYETSKDLWEKHYQEVTQDTIANIFFGRNWTHLMMDVYTEDLKKYYYENYLKRAIGARGRVGEENPASILKEKEVIEMRRLYQNLDRKEIFKAFPNYSERVITSIISGQNWKHLPVYKKRQKQWFFPEEWNEEQIQDFKNAIGIISDSQ